MFMVILIRELRIETTTTNQTKPKQNKTKQNKTKHKNKQKTKQTKKSLYIGSNPLLCRLKDKAVRSLDTIDSA